MIVTYPHLGDTYIALEVFFRAMGVGVISPPLSSARTLNLGAELSPEFICVPFKIALGNVIEALELGANTVLGLEKPSGCRLSCYPRLMEAILRARGYPITLRTLWLMNGSAASAIGELRQITGAPLQRIVRAIILGLPVLKTVDDLERAAHRIRPRELTPGAASRVLREAKERLRCVADPSAGSGQALAAFRRIRRESFAALRAIPIDRGRQPLKVILLGEIYAVLDAFMNMNLEEELGRRGVEVERSVYIGAWLDYNMFLRPLRVPETRTLERVARPYLRRNIAGDGLKSIGQAIRYAQAGYDGVIHAQSFTCMPEIMASCLMPAVSRDYDIPVLRLVFDEQTGRAGMVTRVEAFLDLLERRRGGVKRET